jgi:plasmid stabilization system protein ParE
MGKVHFTRRARQDLLDIWIYIAPRNSEAVADAVHDRVEQACERLKHHPQLGAARERAPRTEAIRRNSYQTSKTAVSRAT